MDHKVIKYLYAICISLLLLYNLINFNALSNSKQNYERVKAEYEQLNRQNQLLEKELAYTNSEEYLKQFLIDNFGEGIELNNTEEQFVQDYGETFEVEEHLTNIQKWIDYFGF